MSIITTDQITTAEELLRLPAGSERVEMIAGELRILSPSGAEHVVVSAELLRRLGNYVHDQKLGRVFSSEGGFIIQRNPDTVIAPDAAFVSTEKIAIFGIPRGYWVGPPDLAVEVVSPHDRMTEVDDKVDAWLKAGTRLVWVIHPRRRIAMVHRPDRPVGLIRADEHLDGQDVVPGFQCRLGDIFVS
jgi:Uma2 family endonuclease